MNTPQFLRRVRVLFAIILATLLVGCAPLRILNTLVPERDFEVTRDIEFSPLPRNKLDVYKPTRSASASAPKPVVVFFYGGAWDSGGIRGRLAH